MTAKTKPRGHRGAWQDRHIAVATFRCAAATCTGPGSRSCALPTARIKIIPAITIMAFSATGTMPIPGQMSVHCCTRRHSTRRVTDASNVVDGCTSRRQSPGDRGAGDGGTTKVRTASQRRSSGGARTTREREAPKLPFYRALYRAVDISRYTSSRLEAIP